MNETYQPGTLTPLIPEKKPAKKQKVQAFEPQPGSRKMMPLIPPPPAPVVKESPVRNPFEIGLLNLSGLGIGYLFMHRWVRWIIHFVLIVGLVVAAFLTKGHNLPWLWAGLFILFLLWMAFDGWRLTRKSNIKRVRKNIPGSVRAWAFGAIALIVVIGAYAGYSLLGKNVFHKGMAAYQDSNCASAEKYLKQMGSIYELTFTKNIDMANSKIAECDLVLAAEKKIESTSYESGISLYREFEKTFPDSPLVVSVKEKKATAYVNWGMALRTSGKYAEAIDRFLQVKTSYSQTSASTGIDEKLAATTLLWANDLRGNQSYAEAISKYQSITSQYPLTTSSASAVDEIVNTYSGWAANLREAGKYQDAIGKYNILLSQFPQTLDGKNAGLEIGKTYVEWSSSLTKRGDFLGAMEMIDSAKEDTPDTTLLSNLDKNYQSALMGLSQDQGIQGTQIVNETVSLACDGKPAASPAVGLGSTAAKAQFCNSSEVSLPSELYASTPADIKYVLRFASGTSTIETCPYEGGYSFTRYQDYWTITVISTKTGKITNSNTFYGSSPEECSGSRWFTIGDYSDSASGGYPDEYAVINWLKNNLK